VVLNNNHSFELFSLYIIIDSMKYLHFVAYKVHVRIYHSSLFFRGSHGHDRMVVGFTATCAICAYHLESSNPTHGKVYSIHYVIKFVIDL